MNKSIKKLFVKIVYNNDRELLHNPFKRSQDYFILQVFFSTVFALLTGGVFLSGFAVYLGANDEVISFITIMPTMCGIFLLIGGVFLENVRSKKKTVITLVIASKLLMCLIVTIPLFVPEAVQEWVLFVSMIAAYTLQALSGIVINKWFISVVPGNIRGRYFAVRQSFALGVTVVLPLITGCFMDSVSNKYTGFVVLYSLGLLAMLVEVYAYWRIEEPAIECMEKGNTGILDVIRLPLKNKEFRNYVILLFIFFVILFLSCSFTQAYMLRYLKLPYTVINLISIFSAVLQMFLLRFWGAMGDRYGHKFVMNTSIWFFAGETLFWAIASKSTIIICIPIACMFSAIANSGFAIGVFNRRYMIIPEKGRAIYDGFYSAAIGVALIIAPIMGGSIKAFLASNDFVQKNIQFGEFRVLYMVSCVGIILLKVINILIRKRCNDSESPSLLSVVKSMNSRANIR